MTTLDSPRVVAPSGERAWRAALAGSVSAGAALAFGELPSAIAGEPVGPITAVGNEFVDRYAASLKDLAVALFGQNDKAALVIGIVTVSVVLGAVLGLVALRSFRAAAAGFVLFGLVGLVAGIGSRAVLLVWISPPAPRAAARRWGPADDPRSKAPDRRSFLIAAGSVGAVAALTGLGNRSLRGRSTVEAQREALVLPRPVRSTPVPATGTLDVEGISPYLTPTSDFYRIDTALVTPQVNAESWRLRIGGLVDEPYELTFDELLTMDLVEEPVTIACVSNEVGGDLVGTARWLGVPLVDLLDRAGVQREGTQVVGRSTDGFTAGFPTQTALDGRVAMVAVGMNGEPLPARHGYPARLIVAGLYGYVSATKWLTEIELTRFDDFDAYWVPRGWSKLGPVKTQSRIDVPRAGGRVDAGTVAVAGVAWAPTVGIAAVEVSIDDGPWEPAQLGASANDNTWVQWVHRWDAEPGDHTIRCRATDETGAVQPAERRDPRPDGATGHHTVQVNVRG